MATPTTLPATFVAGNVLTAAQMNDLRGAFRVLQVVQGTTSTAVSNSTSTYADTGLTATITPSSTSSKVLVLVNHNVCTKTDGNTANSLNLKLLRGATDIKTICTALGFTNSLLINYFNASATVFDSPNTTSATTYKTQFANFVAAAAATVQGLGNESSITLLEINA
jgi:hypothetical protein